MAFSVITALAACAAIVLVVYRFVIYPVLVSPLAKIPPAHPSAPFTSIWIFWKRHQFKENAALYAAHNKLGPVIRTAPNEISINCVDGGLRTVYAGGYEKSSWYNFFESYG